MNIEKEYLHYSKSLFSNRWKTYINKEKVKIMLFNHSKKKDGERRRWGRERGWEGEENKERGIENGKIGFTRF